MDICTLTLPYSLLLSALLLVSVSGTQKCAPQVIPDMVIDINQAVAHGARFTDPLSVIHVEECLSACCKQLDAEGVQECNLMVFDARKKRGEPNCYIFHCPKIESCPLTSSPGVFSYSLWSDTPHSEKHDPEKVQQKTKSSDHSKVQSSPERTSGSDMHPTGSTASGLLDLSNKTNGLLITSQEPAKHYVKEEPANSSKQITTRILQLADTIDQHLEKMESKSAASKDNLQVHYPSPIAATVPTIRTPTIPVHGEVKKTVPDAKEAKHGIVTNKMPEDLTFFPTVAAKQMDTVPKKESLSTAAPNPVHRTKANLIVPSASFQDTSAAHKVSSSDTSAKLPGSDDSDNSGTPMVTPKKVDHPLPHTEVPTLATVHQTRPPQMVTRPAPLQTSPWKEIKPSTKTNNQTSASAEDKKPGHTLPVTHPPSQPVINLEDSPRKADSTASQGFLPSLEDKSGLVAALVFGMLFLLVIIGLISRKVSEARRRHRYTKLDYLINGMYVDT